LVALTKQDHRGAFNEIYERYWLQLYTAARKRLNSADDAKDIVQDLFVSLWLKRQSLVINTRLSSYLFTAVKYRVINHIEANMVKADYLSSLDRAIAEYDNSTHDIIISRDLERHLDCGIEKLSPKMKVVFELSRREHLSVNEIAGRLNLSEQTVKNQITKAMKILRLHVSDISATIVLLLLISL
jgi:RNA polymerase sigma-70 factor (ECF subfamily)